MEAATNEKIEPALLTLKEMCEYLRIGETQARKILTDRNNGFSIKIGNRLYANKKKLDRWIENNTK